jgi:hypothetical protein
MDCELPCHPYCHEMLVESLAEVLTPAIGVQYLDPGAMLLSDCPCFEELVVLKSLIFCGDQVDGYETK